MKLTKVIGAILPFITHGNEMSAADKFYQLEIASAFGPSIWTFGKSGVNVYSVDGNKVLISHSNMDICGAKDCQFRHAVSDGKRHVYATNNGQGTVDVFSIDNGEMMASLDACGSPWSLDYHPRREELWVHCWSPNESDGDTGHVDVFSTSSLHSPMSQVKLPPALVGHAHGTVVVDSSLGHFGYGTDLNTPSLFKIDLNKREHLASYDLPKVSGLYRMVYSKVNRHLYMRAYVCCSCGFTGADLPNCGRGGSRPVNVTTGPNQGSNLDGTCGHGCEGSVADTIGVYEFDTVQNTRVGNWQISDGFGADPYVSPEGDFIALFGNNGGGTVRLMKPGRNGSASQLWADVKVGLKEPDTDSTAKSISDATFIQDSKHNVVIFTSTLSNSVALVDLSQDTPVVRKLLLTDASEITSKHGRGARRNVVWVIGTDYVWVDSEVTEEFHIIKLSPDGDVAKATLEKTFPGVGVRNLLYVENYEAKNEMKAANSNIVQQVEREDKTIDSVGISGLTIASISLVLVLLNVFMMMRRKPKSSDVTNDEMLDNLEKEYLPSQV